MILKDYSGDFVEIFGKKFRNCGKFEQRKSGVTIIVRMCYSGPDKRRGFGLGSRQWRWREVEKCSRYFRIRTGKT